MKKTIDFSVYSSIKIGSPHEVEVIESVVPLDAYNLIGSCSNMLISPTATNLAVLSKKYDYLSLDGNTLAVGGATPSGRIHSFCKKHNLGGLEYLGKLPGTLGGLVRMNAGMKEYEIKSHIKTINGEDAMRFDFEYRKTNIDAIIYEATFELSEPFSSDRVELFEAMRANQPKEPSCGSFFKNPKPHSAGKLLQDAGLKGYRLGGVGFSEIHANFLVNYGNGKFDEVMELKELAKRRVFEAFGIVLEEEVIII